MAGKRIGLKDVAMKAGVSITTVSYVLNNANVTISQETRDRVLQAADELCYRPNWMAQGLKLSRYNTVGVVVEDIRSFFINELINGICRYAEENGIRVILYNLRSDDRADIYGNYDLGSYSKRIEALVRNALGNQVDNIIYAGAYYRDISDIFNVDDYVVSYVYCCCENKLSVHYNDEQGARLATEYLINRGHRRIAYIDALGDTIPGRQRETGFHSALKAAGIEYVEDWHVICDISEESGYQAALKLLSLKERPTAVFASADPVCISIYRVCKELGICIPDELSVIGFDNREYASYMFPPLTSISFPIDSIGYRVMKEACEQENTRGSILLDCSLVERASVCPPVQS